MLRADYHTHSRYSDGKSSMEDNVLAARAKGIRVLGFSDHAWGHAFYGYKRRDLEKIRGELELLREKYPDMRLLLGVEANILGPSGDLDVTEEELKLFDVVLAGYHFGSKPKSLQDLGMHLINYLHRIFGVFRKKAIELNTQALIRAMERYNFLILTHPGDKGPVDIRKVAMAAQRCGKVLEINERHHHLTAEQLREIKDLPLRYVLSSDAHLASHVGVVDQALQRIEDAGIDPAQVINLQRRKGKEQG